MENVNTVLYHNQCIWNPIIFLNIINIRHLYLMQLYIDNAVGMDCVCVTLLF